METEGSTISPRIKHESYNERDVLVDYIYDSDLMTDEEQLALEVLVVRLQADALTRKGDAEGARELLAQQGHPSSGRRGWLGF